jgi:tetratricopeptide (TPR) repeat protein
MKNKKELISLDFEIQFYEGVLKQKPDFIQALIALGDAYTKRGLFEKGLFVDKRLSSLKPEDPVVWYNLACDYSLLNNTDSGIKALNKAVGLGYDDFDFMNRDPDLENLRRDSRFEKLIINFKKK